MESAVLVVAIFSHLLLVEHHAAQCRTVKPAPLAQSAQPVLQVSFPTQTAVLVSHAQWLTALHAVLLTLVAHAAIVFSHPLVGLLVAPCKTARPVQLTTFVLNVLQDYYQTLLDLNVSLAQWLTV